MKRKIQIILLALALGTTMAACNNSNTSEETKTEETSKTDSNKETENVESTEDVESEEAKSTDVKDFTDKLQGEDGVVRWVRGHSGNLMMTMARENGYLEEYGLKVEEIPMQTTDESFAAVSGDQVDIVSNAGTNEPLQRIAVGDGLKIFGGHMVEGAMFVIGPAGSLENWKGVESLVGKKVAGADAGTYAITGLLLEQGYDPKTDVEWIKAGNAADAMSAVKSGLADYASVGTELAHQVKTDPEIDELAKHGDLMDKYSCCRMETASRFIENKPNTTKALIKALLRGMRDYEKDPDEATKLLAEELDMPIEFVEAYTLDSGYEISPDPLYNSCVRAWAYMDELGMLDGNADNIDLREHITVDLYKEALDEVIEEVGDEDPEYWDGVLKYFEENNSMYYDEAEEQEYYENLQKTIEENRAKNAN